MTLAYDEQAPYRIVVGKNISDSYVEYRGERLPGLKAAVVQMGPGEEVRITIQLWPQVVHIDQDKSVLSGGRVPLHVPEPPFGEPLPDAGSVRLRQKYGDGRYEPNNP